MGDRPKRVARREGGKGKSTGWARASSLAASPLGQLGDPAVVQLNEHFNLNARGLSYLHSAASDTSNDCFA